MWKIPQKEISALPNKQAQYDRRKGNMQRLKSPVNVIRLSSA